MQTLDDILSGKTEEPKTEAAPAPEPVSEPPPVTEPPATPGEPPAPEPKPGQPRDEQGKFAPKPRDEAPAAPPAARQESHPHVPINALLDEREKRQALERRIAEMEAAQKKAEPPKRPDLFEDPNGALGHIEQTFEQKLQAQRMEMQAHRLDMSVAMAKSSFQDYDDAEAAFIQAAQQNPALAQQMQQHPHPALFAYQTGKAIKALSEIGDPLSFRERTEKELREKLEAELRQKLEAEYAAKQPQAPVAPSLPTPLASAPAAAPRGVAPWPGPTPLGTVINPRRS